jgi:hypothetical protein
MHSVRRPAKSCRPIQHGRRCFANVRGELNSPLAFLMQQTPKGRAMSAFGIEFEWDTPLVQRYRHVFANNAVLSPPASRRDEILLQGHELLSTALSPDPIL